MSTDSTILFCPQKQVRKINAMRRVVLKKELSVISHEIWRSLLAKWICYIAAKKPQPLCERGTKRELGEQGKCCHRLIVHSITRRGEIWGGGWSEETVGGGGGGRLLCANLYTSRVKWYDNTYTFQLLLKKGLLLTVIRIRGTAETRRCDADAVRSQVITWNPALTLCASYLPPPPPPLPAPPPLSQASVLIVTLVNPTRGTQGCPKIISFDKNHWHFKFLTKLFNLLFSLLLYTSTFFATPLAKKMHSLFSASH